MRSAGDVNRDSHADLIVATNFDWKNYEKGDVARVFSGRDGRLLHAIQGDYNATDVTGVGDLNRDGNGDSACLLPGPLAVDVLLVSGKDGKPLYRVRGIAAGARSIASAGDVNGDGTPDVLVGDKDLGALFHPGRAVVLSGKNGSVLHDLRAWDFNQVEFGWAVSGAGDVDRDGHADFLVSDCNYGGANPRQPVGAGRVWLYSGKTAKVLYTWTGAARGDVFGASVAAAGDVDRDGVPDVIVGSPGNSKNGIRSGVAHVYSGKTGLVIRTFRGKAASAMLGYS
ncbi:MAG: VCBS repeat-containing protein [Planctomycetota bacterium]